MVDNSLLSTNKPRVVFWAYKTAFKLASGVPISAGQGLGVIFGGLAYLMSQKKRRIVRNNLKPVFGESGNFSELVVLKAFNSYARFWFESFKLGSMTRQEVQAKGREEDLELLYGAIKEGRGAIAVAAHLGNWDFGAAWFDDSRAKANAVVEALEPPELFRWFVDFRLKFGLTAIAHNDNPMPKLVAAIRRNEVIALVSDRALDAATAEVDFFSQRVKLPMGPAILALRTNAPLIPIACYMEPKGGHLTKVLPEIQIGERKGLREDAQRLTQEIAWALEELIKFAPEQWHVFSPIFGSTSKLP